MGTFIQDQILGMKWLNALFARGLTAAGIDVQSKLGASVNFFLYDTVKIAVLLCVLIFCISYVQSYFPPERSRRIMGRFRGVTANAIGALLGGVFLTSDDPSSYTEEMKHKYRYYRHLTEADVTLVRTDKGTLIEYFLDGKKKTAVY